MVNTPCDYCGSPASTNVDSEGSCSCVNCARYFYTCSMCENGRFCEFDTNPSPIPKVVMQTIRRGPTVIQTQVKNPQRIEEFCHKCFCWNSEESICSKEDNWCKKYHEIYPPFRDQRLYNT